MRYLLFLVMLLGFSACSNDPEYVLESVEVVVVHCEMRKGSNDCHTIVQFPDSTRRKLYDKWGELGDVFKARKVHESIFISVQ